jgi:hypothetical protein
MNSKTKKMKGRQSRLPHRGAPNDIPRFAEKFLKARLEGFEKDMRICLRGKSVDLHRRLIQ